MEEKTIITGEKGRFYKLFVIAASLFLFVLLLYILNAFNCRSYSYYYYDKYPITSSFFDLFRFETAFYGGERFFLGITLYLSILLGIISMIIYLSYRKVSITVTDKRVYGTAAWGKRVDLPFDSISAVGTSMMQGISVATSSGAIKFKFIKNFKDIHSAISQLLLERQGKEKPVETTTIKQEIPQSNADELKKYKDLLDCGVITQEEFDTKKKQLLGL